MIKKLITASAIWVILSIIVMSITAYLLQCYIPQLKYSIVEWIHIQLGIFVIFWAKGLVDDFWGLSESISSQIYDHKNE